MADDRRQLLEMVEAGRQEAARLTAAVRRAERETRATRTQLRQVLLLPHTHPAHRRMSCDLLARQVIEEAHVLHRLRTNIRLINLHLRRP